VEVERRVIFGKDIAASEITTSFVERCNLTMRQDNKRLARKKLAFSKKQRDLDEQMTLYFAHFNLCRPHMSLKRRHASGRSARRTPMMILGVPITSGACENRSLFLIIIHHHVIRSISDGGKTLKSGFGFTSES
jgi:hypothetical protein